jgi:hypothetical protein
MTKLRSQEVNPSRLTRRLEKVEIRLNPPATEKVIVVIEYVSAETKTVVATQTIENGVIGPKTAVKPSPEASVSMPQGISQAARASGSYR